MAGHKLSFSATWSGVDPMLGSTFTQFFALPGALCFHVNGWVMDPDVLARIAADEEFQKKATSALQDALSPILEEAFRTLEKNDPSEPDDVEPRPA